MGLKPYCQKIFTYWSHTYNAYIMVCSHFLLYSRKGPMLPNITDSTGQLNTPHHKANMCSPEASHPSEFEMQTLK